MVSSHSILLDLSAAFDLVFHSVLLEFFFLAALGLCYCVGCLVAASRGYSLIAVCGRLIAMASLAAERAPGTQASVLAAHGLSS